MRFNMSTAVGASVLPPEWRLRERLSPERKPAPASRSVEVPLRGDDLRTVSSFAPLRLVMLDFLLTNRLLSNELGLPSVVDVATGAAGAAFAFGFGIAKPRGCEDADEATLLGLLPADEENPSRMGGEAAELKLARWERMCPAPAGGPGGMARALGRTAIGDVGEVGDAGGGGGDIVLIDRNGSGERTCVRLGTGDPVFAARFGTGEDVRGGKSAGEALPGAGDGIACAEAPRCMGVGAGGERRAGGDGGGALWVELWRSRP
jgi:hypothetical protein